MLFRSPSAGNHGLSHIIAAACRIGDANRFPDFTRCKSHYCFLIASGVSTPDDVYNVIKLGADETGATSGILKADSPKEMIMNMALAINRAMNDR